ncbi:MAG: family 43 glycosylhydrolase, partial [Clostridia bacterium]|nr:family 43 glycosylhydrolase [Clostridia bacterium]
SYLDRKTASRLISVRFEPIVAGQSCTLSVSDFTCALQQAPEDDILFIENDHFKAGVNLKWGGGLSWFEDKTNSNYGNLLNNHDTGRLVQQSYYGPQEIEGYENAMYVDTEWGYNPVQGGDQYGNHSKLVAVEKTEDEIRIVCRPLDWAQNNMFTQTYYTNVYKLTENGLTVKNTVVDFLNTPWADRDQELPAFYTVSALGNFCFYDGDKPWTGDELRVERNLPFWAGQPAFQLKDGNNEKWCAWTDDSDYGVGLFSPKAKSLLAGRFLYDGSADPGSDSTNYVAPIGVFGLEFDEPYSYLYYMTAGSVEEIRNTFGGGENLMSGDFRRVFPDMGVCDPHVHIFDGKAYLFSSHDYGPGQPIYRMDDWRVFSSDDLVNWDLEFTLRPEDTFLGEDHECYAIDAAERNGKYYLYFSDQQRCTGVAVSENGPGGPYVDALGEPLLPQGLVDTACYDPTVFIDDDENKTPYIMFGYTVVGKKYYIARLNEDMISLAEEPKAVEVIDGWENDACWITKWGDTYYLNSHGGDYATSKNIYGPYTYRGKICEDCFTDHGTFFTFHNQTYFTYAVPENYGSGEPLDPYYRTTKFVYAHMKDNGDIVTDDFIKKVGVGQYDATWESIKGEWFFDAADGIVKKENADGFELRGIKDGSYLSFPNILNVPADALLKLRVANGNDQSCTVEI